MKPRVAHDIDHQWIEFASAHLQDESRCYNIRQEKTGQNNREKTERGKAVEVHLEDILPEKRNIFAKTASH